MSRRGLLLVLCLAALQSVGAAAQSSAAPASPLPPNARQGTVFGSIDELQFQFFNPRPVTVWRLDDTRTLSLYEWGAVLHTWRMLVLTEKTADGERLSYVGLPSSGRVMSCSCGDTITVLSPETLPGEAQGELMRLDLERTFGHPQMHTDIDECRRATCFYRVEEIWTFIFDTSGPLDCLACQLPRYYRSYLSVYEGGDQYEIELAESRLSARLDGGRLIVEAAGGELLEKQAVWVGVHDLRQER